MTLSNDVFFRHAGTLRSFQKLCKFSLNTRLRNGVDVFSPLKPFQCFQEHRCSLFLKLGLLRNLSSIKFPSLDGFGNQISDNFIVWRGFFPQFTGHFYAKTMNIEFSPNDKQIKETIINMVTLLGKKTSTEPTMTRQSLRNENKHQKHFRIALSLWRTDYPWRGFGVFLLLPFCVNVFNLSEIGKAAQCKNQSEISS